MEMVDDFVYLTDSTGTVAHWTADGGHNEALHTRDDVLDRVGRFEYPPVAEQLAFPLEAMTRDQATFLYYQKALSQNPTLDSLAYYRSRIDNASLVAALAAEDVGIKGMDANVRVAEQVAADGEACAALAAVVATSSGGPTTLTDGSTGTNAYHANATCVWVLDRAGKG